MFWKKDKSRRKGWSIIVQLTLLYTFSIMVILAIISGTLFYSLKENLHKNERQFLHSEARLLDKLNGRPKRFLIHYLHDEKEDTLDDYWETLLTTSIYGVLISAFLGFLLAHRSMRPVKNITLAMEKTSVTNLKYRLNVEKNWPKEFTHLARHFNHMLNRLETSFTHLSDFSANLAHELRTPINNLKGEAEICLMKARSPAEYQQIIGSSLEEYDRLSRIIENILFLARAEVPENQLLPTKIAVRKTVLAILEFYLPIAEEKNIRLHCIGDEENQLMLRADEVLFQRVLHNLCSNALRYTTSGGEITIKIASENKKIMIQVIDTGIGVAPEHIPYLFKRFYRTDSARAKESGGNGLGLAIVKSIMDLHHAKITIDSVLGKGTTVSLVF